jgi:hypothetical protein
MEKKNAQMDFQLESEKKIKDRELIKIDISNNGKSKHMTKG